MKFSKKERYHRCQTKAEISKALDTYSFGNVPSPPNVSLASHDITRWFHSDGAIIFLPRKSHNSPANSHQQRPHSHTSWRTKFKTKNDLNHLRSIIVDRTQWKRLSAKSERQSRRPSKITKCERRFRQRKIFSLRIKASFLSY